MKLHIDTAEKGRLNLKLITANNKVFEHAKYTEKLSENLLLEIERFLRKYRVKLKDLNAVSVNPGPGSFSSTRTGVATANALNFALELKKNIILPKYDRAPNITKPKT